MTYEALLTEVTRRTYDEQRALLAALAFRMTDDLTVPRVLAYPATRQIPLPAGDLAFPDDPAEAELEAEFE